MTTETSHKRAPQLPPPPNGLGLRGSEFWTAAQSQLEFDERETDLLTEVCRTLDTIDLLSAAIDTDGVMLTGSQGQRVLNGAVAERRQQQAAYARLVTQLNLDGAEEPGAMKTPRSASAAETAKRRWAQKKNRGFGA
jgi:hypothetical protein